MAGRFDFTSPGAAMSGALEKFLYQRLKEQQDAEENSRANARLTLEQQREGRANELQRQQASDLENERQFRRATVISQNALPDDEVDPETEAMLKKQGFGNMVRVIPGKVDQGPQIDEQDGVPIYSTSQQPEQHKLRGGERYLSAREAEKARAAQAEAAAADRAALNSENRLSREQMAADAIASREGIAAASRENARIIAGMSASIRREAQDQKTATAEEAKENARVALQDYGDSMMDLITKLTDDKGNLNTGAQSVVGGLQGRQPRMLQSEAQAAYQSYIDSLVAKLDIGTISAMKAQSRTGATGFGALNKSELDIIENAASRLKAQNVNEQTYAEAIGDIRKAIETSRARAAAKKPAAAPGGGGAPAPGGAAPKKKLRFDPATGKAQ